MQGYILCKGGGRLAAWGENRKTKEKGVKLHGNVVKSLKIASFLVYDRRNFVRGKNESQRWEGGK